MAPPLRSPVICLLASKAACEALKSGFKRNSCKVGGSIFHFMKMEEIPFLLQKNGKKIHESCKKKRMMDCSTYL